MKNNTIQYNKLKILKTITLLFLGFGFFFIVNCLFPTKEAQKEANKSARESQILGYLISQSLIQKSNFSPYTINSVTCQDPPPISNNYSSFTCTLEISGGENASCTLNLIDDSSSCNTSLSGYSTCSNGSNTISISYSGTCNGAVNLTFKATSQPTTTYGTTQTSEKTVSVTF